MTVLHKHLVSADDRYGQYAWFDAGTQDKIAVRYDLACF